MEYLMIFFSITTGPNDLSYQEGNLKHLLV